MKAVVLTKGRIATVDDEEFDRVDQYKWCAAKCGNHYYAKSRVGYLHHFISGFSFVDHRNGDTLDNQRLNLRESTHKRNLRAFNRKRDGKTSEFRGVHWASRDKRWVAKIRVDYRRISLGDFTDEKQAARAYDAAARIHFGSDADLNFK